MSGCECHHFSKPCPLRGRRAPECAAGYFQEFVNKTVAVAQSMFVTIGAGLGETSTEWRKLNNEWHIGLDCIITECKLKSMHWQQLPWVLCGLAVREAEQARSIGRKVISMHDDGQNMDAMITFGRKHPLSARFLRKTFGDGALRPLLDQFVRGADLATDPELEPLRQWIGALRLIRIVERETEAT
eukprot:Skav228982  [mRNA]  locus=scaffold1053:49742:50299:+ [translate_table: standard]